MHDDCFVWFWYDPGAHRLQLVLLDTLAKRPAGHDVQLVDMFVGEYWPTEL